MVHRNIANDSQGRTVRFMRKRLWLVEGVPNVRRPVMHNVLVDGGTIRKLWIGEAAKYRDHLLRLDPESRRNRFGGAVSDEFIENFVELTLGLDAVIHGFFVDG